MKKITSLLLILFLLFTFSSCKKNDVVTDDFLNGDEEDLGSSLLKLAYSKNDSLNPFLSESEINCQITKLVYDGLYSLDETYKPSPVIANSAIVSDSVVNISLGDAKFSDGSAITASDIVFSFNTAKESSRYSTSLSNFTSAVVSSSDMVIFNLEYPDPYALSCLDFPVIKMNSDEEFPVGSGRFIYVKNGDTVFLVINVNKSDFSPNIKTIELVPVHESDSVGSSLVIGGIGYYYNNLNSGEYNRIDANSYDVGINNLIYLGFNSDNEFFEKPEARKAISLCIDRNEIVKSSFRNHARPSSLPFNPDWYAIEFSDSSLTSDFDKAKEYLKESGIEPRSRELALLYNSENGFKSETAKNIKMYLNKLGFFVRLYPCNAEDYMYALKKGDYDLFIGEVKLSKNMNLNPLFSGSASFGVNSDTESAGRYNSLIHGECELMDFINTFMDDYPFVPLCFRNAVSSYTKSIEISDYGCDSDVFYNIESWRLK